MSIAAPKKVSFIHYIIVFALCFLFRFIPGFAGITPLGMGILGSFLLALFTDGLLLICSGLASWPWLALG